MSNELYTLFFEVTQMCNAFCDHCGSRCDSHAKEELDSKYFKQVLDDVKERYGTKRIMLNITGGEPLMRHDLFDIVEYADGLGFKWGLVTNGMLITDNIIQEMERTNMSTITISLDGMKETHERFRHVKGCFDKIIAGIYKLKEAAFVEHIQVTFIATKENLKELPEVYRMLAGIGIDSLRISGIDPIGRAEDNNSLMLDREDYEFLFSFMKQKEGSSLPVIWSCTHYFGDDGINSDVTGKIFHCYTGIHVASVLYNGDIFGCPNIPRFPKLIQGNVKTDNFCDVWENRFEYFRNPDRTKAEQCHECKYYKNCKGDSLHTFDFENNRPKFCYREMFCNETTNPTVNEFTYNDFLKGIKNANVNLNRLIVTSNCYTPKHKVVLTPQATKDVFHYFHYGERHPLNVYEQLMALIGNIGADGTSFVRFCIPVAMNNRAGNLGTIDDSCFSYINSETEIINENIAKSDDLYKKFGVVEFLGFVHSHPENTDFKFSKNDTKNHAEFVNKFRRFDSLLINPQKKLFAGFYGPDCMQSCLEVYYTHLD